MYYSLKRSASYIGPIYGSGSDFSLLEDTKSGFGLALPSIILSVLSFLELVNPSHISMVPQITLLLIKELTL